MCENVNRCQPNALHGSATMSTGYLNNEHIVIIRTKRQEIALVLDDLLLNIIQISNLH